jgi:5'(3')-deoxyribonucleotidase
MAIGTLQLIGGMTWAITMAELLLDMDGVIADTMGAVCNRLDIIHADIEDYWFDGLDTQAILSILREDGFYRHLDVITGAVGAVNRLRSQYDVRVCSQPMEGAENCEQEKREWLAEHFDSDFAEQALIVPDKSIVKARAIIEDNPDITGDFQPIMFHQAWNRRADYPRMYGWQDLHIVRRVLDGA